MYNGEYWYKYGTNIKRKYGMVTIGFGMRVILIRSTGIMKVKKDFMDQYQLIPQLFLSTLLV